MKNNQLPYMNRELRKAIYTKKMYYSNFLKDKSSKNWEQYRLRRNLVNKLKRKLKIIISKKNARVAVNKLSSGKP